MADGDEELSNQLNEFRDYKKRIWAANNKLLLEKIERLKALRQHYTDYWLDLNLESYDSKLDLLVSKTKYTVYQASKRKVDSLTEAFNQENAKLDNQIDEAQSRLENFRNLDSGLLAQYRELKDDLECQQMLIEISENNMGKQ